MPTRLAVSEIFGPTFQGEGPSLGREAVFLRLAMCNLKCSWCDTKYTWDWSQYDKQQEVKLMDPREVFDEIMHRASSARLLVVTGGEPLLQQKALLPVAGRWPYRVEIETNGTIAPQFRTYDMGFNVSPKLANSGNPYERRYNFPALRKLALLQESVFKFVVQHLHDLTEIEALSKALDISPDRIWIMPQGTTPEELTTNSKLVAEEVLKRGWNLTTRLHVQLWNNVRGR